MTYHKIGLLRLSAIGDAVLTVPMVRALQNAYPNAEITWIIGRAAYALLSGLSGIHFIVVDKPKSLRDYYHFWRKMRAYKFDVFIAMQASLRANLMYPLISSKRKIGFDKARAKDGHHLFINESIAAEKNHLLDGFMGFVRHLGIQQPSKPSWNLALNEVELPSSLSLKKPYIIINPAASKYERNWLIERYIELIHCLQTSYPELTVIITGSQDDINFVQPILDKTGAMSAVGKTTLKQLACLIGDALCVIAPDTGSVHIASAMNTPVIGLYAVITSKLSGPYLSMNYAIDKYDEAIYTCLNKDPSSIEWGTRVHSLEAMKLISVDEVFNMFQKVLKEKRIID